MNVLARQGDVEFYVTSTYTLEDLRRVQRRSIEMFQQIAEILDRHEIAYTLGYGSLLGQVRHAGYIPWDDDIDLLIMDRDYGRAILHLRRELSDDLLLHNKRNDPVYWVTWVKVRDLKSDTVESMWKIDRKLKYHGVAIDLIRVTSTTVGKYRQTPIIKELNARKKQLAKQHRSRSSLKRLLSTPGFAVVDLTLRIQVVYHRLRRKLGRKGLLVAAPGTIIEQTFAYDDVFPIRHGGPLFEGMTVKTPRNPEGVLRSMYGEFESLPPLEERVPHFESVTFFDDVTDGESVDANVADEPE
jgi:lipopolysaccharide cholinephosphotransferase